MQLSNISALPPPKGVQSNFDDPHSQGQDVIIASVICLTLMALFVSMRIYSKAFIKHSWGWNDRKQFASHLNVIVNLFASDMCMLASVILLSVHISIATISPRSRLAQSVFLPFQYLVKHLKFIIWTDANMF